VVDFLLDATATGKTPYRARAGAVRGLAKLAPYVGVPVRTRIIERCRDLLRDPEANIRLAAARALSAARAYDETVALEAYRATLPLQQKVVIDQILNGLRRDDNAGLRALQRQVEELQSKIRQLVEKVQDIEDLRDLQNKRSSL
jgi:hypothetical protein